MRCTLLLPLLCSSSPSPTEIASQSNIVWNDAHWKGDGSGSMPMGNGDVTANVWVDGDTGELSLLVGKSDVFDQNGQPVHVGLVRIAFEPPLWGGGAPAPLPPTPGNGSALEKYSKLEHTIVKQTTQFTPPAGWTCHSQASCAEESAELCDALGTACQGFSLDADFSGGVMPELSTTGEAEQRKGTEAWTLWQKPASPPGPAPPSVFRQTLNLAEASIDIETPAITVRIFVDADTSVLRVVASSAGDMAFDVAARIEPYRADEKTKLSGGFCHERYESADIVVGSDLKPAGLAGAAVWYHRNPDNASFFTDTIMDQGVDPKAAGLHDPFAGLTFGGALYGEGFAPVNDTVISGQGFKSATFNVGLLTKQSPAKEWLDSLGKLVVGTARADAQAHAEAWAAVWGRSYLNITAAAGASDSDTAAAKNVMDHAHWQRFLELVQAMRGSSPIKFNGQAFTVNNSGKGWDFRDWGASYWWQNTRQPYYNSLAQGDVDVLRSMLSFYHRMLPYVQARTEAQFKNTETPIVGGVAALYPETTTQFGSYQANDWGCNSGGHRNHGASGNSYIRFHWTGSLELCLFFLDDYKVTLDATFFEAHGLPVCTAVIEGFRQRFPNTDSSNKTDMWPTQALETYQCRDPTSRSNCPGNVATDIGGLQAVLTRLLALPSELVSAADLRSAWREQLELLPALPIAGGKIIPFATGGSRRSNSENTALYAVHPFRLYGTGKADLDIAQATYKARPSPCNQGWCQDLIDAAMLNLTDDATNMVTQRASAGPASGFRFPAFAAHYQDYEPSLDHYAFMRTAINYMLMSPLDDEKEGILLFPTWPVDKWDVSFKLVGPLNTVVEASCEGGVLTRLVVTPAERKADIQVLNCKIPETSEEMQV